MSFLSEIRKQKQKLQQTDTIVTSADGRSHVERRVGSVTVTSEPEQTSHGFVVDTKPDEVPALVIPGLYIGSQDCATESVLAKYGITNVLSLGIESDVSVNRKFVSCLDLPETDVKLVLDECVPFIKSSLDRGQNVLVHCNAGVSRAAMAVIGYLRLQKEYSYEDAYSLVKRKRPAIQPNVGFVRQLKKLQGNE